MKIYFPAKPEDAEQLAMLVAMGVPVEHNTYKPGEWVPMPRHLYPMLLEELQTNAYADHPTLEFRIIETDLPGAQ